MKELFIDIKPANEMWAGVYDDMTLASVKIGEEVHGHIKHSVVNVSLENARILKAARAMYEALCAEYDMITPSEEADRLARKALEIAEGGPRPETRKFTCRACKHAYLGTWDAEKSICVTCVHENHFLPASEAEQ